ncbi:MAG: hypothetical protein R3Y35_08270 [Clostridia bacterium]
MEKDIYFERCMDFMAKMIEKYGNELLADKEFQELVKNSSTISKMEIVE